jgi:hypothetical protein
VIPRLSTQQDLAVGVLPWLKIEEQWRPVCNVGAQPFQSARHARLPDSAVSNWLPLAAAAACLGHKKVGFLITGAVEGIQAI